MKIPLYCRNIAIVLTSMLWLYVSFTAAAQARSSKWKQCGVYSHTAVKVKRGTCAEAGDIVNLRAHKGNKCLKSCKFTVYIRAGRSSYAIRAKCRVSKKKRGSSFTCVARRRRGRTGTIRVRAYYDT